MEIKNNAIYYYDDVRGNWCTHGIVFTVTRNGIMYAIDTYNRQDIEKYKAIIQTPPKGHKSHHGIAFAIKRRSALLKEDLSCVKNLRESFLLNNQKV